MTNRYEVDENIMIEGFDPSKLKQPVASVNRGWEEIYGAKQNNTVLKAVVEQINTIAGVTCAIVYIGNVKGMIPAEHFGVQNKRQMRFFMGKEVFFTVLNYNRDDEIFVGSRVEGQKRIAEITLKKINVGDAIPFVVTGIRSHGLYGDIGGIRAFIPVAEVRFGWIDNIYEEFSIGDNLMVKVLDISKEEQKVDEEETEADKVKDAKSKGEADLYRVSVSAKALHVDPWDAGGVAHRYAEKSECHGTVSGVAEYGVFVNLTDGVDSLARHLKHERVQKGDKVTVRIEDVDIEKQHIRSRILRINEKAN